MMIVTTDAGTVMLLERALDGHRTVIIATLPEPMRRYVSLASRDNALPSITGGSLFSGRGARRC
jgi:hypothetical protein